MLLLPSSPPSPLPLLLHSFHLFVFSLLSLCVFFTDRDVFFFFSHCKCDSRNAIGKECLLLGVCVYIYIFKCCTFGVYCMQFVHFQCECAQKVVSFNQPDFLSVSLYSAKSTVQKGQVILNHFAVKNKKAVVKCGIPSIWIKKHTLHTAPRCIPHRCIRITRGEDFFFSLPLFPGVSGYNLYGIDGGTIASVFFPCSFLCYYICLFVVFVHLRLFSVAAA